MSDRTELFVAWVDSTDWVTAGELLAFSAYTGMTVRETIARLREADVDVLPDHAAP